MRCVVQRVKEASVTVDGEIVGKTGPGILALIGVSTEDTDKDYKYILDKVPNLRIFDDENGVMNRSLLDEGHSILAVSQFTLYANMKEGNRPSFTDCMRPEEAKEKFDLFNKILREMEPSLSTGQFQADMKVSLLNDGPFTLFLDSKELVK